MPRHYKLLLVLAALAAIAVQAGEPENPAKPKLETELRFYDVRDLTLAVTDFPGPCNILNMGTVDPFANPFANHQPAASLTLDNIAELIRDRIRPETWGPALGTAIDGRGGMLFVIQTKETHQLISKLIESLENSSRLQVVVKGLLVPAAELPKETYFDKAALAKLTGNPVAAPRVICDNKQRTHVLSGREFAYIKDYDVSGTSHDPVISAGLEGYVFEVCPLVADDHSSIQVDVRFEFSSNVSLKEGGAITLASPLKSTPAADKPAGTEKSGVKFSASKVAGDLLTIQTQVAVPKGQWVLAGTQPNPDSKGPDDKFLLFFVSAETPEKPAASRAELPLDEAALSLGTITPAGK
jgi:hypothetical protein